MPTFAVVDIETTGGNFHQDRIIEIAIVIHDGQQVIEEISSLINPERPIQPFISRLTGISNKMVRTAPNFEEIAEELYDKLKGHVFVAHNVRFDYSFVKAAFKKVGLQYRAPHFCTVELSRLIFPGHPSYSLGKLCRSLGIQMTNRHRAFGDAAATAELLSRMMVENRDAILKAGWSDELDVAHVPEQLNKDLIDALPEEMGVYMFLDEEGRVLFTAKSANIRQSVISHFKVPLEEQKNALTAFIADVDYQLTGNEAIAALLEQEIIINNQPRFNRILKVPNYKVGIFKSVDDEGYITFTIEPLKNRTDTPVQYFISTQKAERWLTLIANKLQIPPDFKQIYTAETYNRMLEEMVKQFSYPGKHVCIVDNGRSEDERTFIWIKNHQCIGFSFYEGAITYHSLIDQDHKIQLTRETPELRKLLLQYIQKRKNRLKIFHLNNHQDESN